MATATRKPRPRDSKPRAAGAGGDGTDSGATRTGLSRAVIWAGIALGTAVAVLAISGGARPQIGGPPSWLGAVLGVLLVYALIVGAAIALAELTRRHHKAMAGYAIRHGRRGAVAAGRRARRHGSTVHAWLVSKAAPRWESREHRPLMFRKLRGEPEGPAAEEVPAEEHEAGPAPAGTSTPPHDPEKGTTSMAASKITPEHRARRAAARSGGSVPSEWGPVIAAAADFEPENDGELLDWMARQVTGLSAWAEALVDTYEHCTSVIGIDPKASAMLHAVADAAAQAAETMAAAKAKFTEHYELPREFAANGGLMTHDGRWVTGEGA
jgi:hypothetical protein